jgi:DHA2 family methylenomycin A resistance protein-like MFS transporter
MTAIQTNPSRLWLAVIATSLEFVLVQLDLSIVNVGIARIGASLDTGIAGLEWVVDAYTLAFASLMLSAGSLSDRLGLRRTFVLGLSIFISTSFACGIAPNSAVLSVAHVGQGTGVPPGFYRPRWPC